MSERKKQIIESKDSKFKNLDEAKLSIQNFRELKELVDEAKAVLEENKELQGFIKYVKNEFGSIGELKEFIKDYKSFKKELEQVLKSSKIESIEKKEIINTEELSIYAGMAESTIAKKRSLREIPFYKSSSGGVYYKMAEIKEMLTHIRHKSKYQIDCDVNTQAVLNTIKKRSP